MVAYYGSVVPCPKYLKDELDRSIFDFYWSSKPNKIRRDTIRGPSELGGTGLINISCKLDALLLKWLQKYSSRPGKWKFLFEFWIKQANTDQSLGWFVFNNAKLIGSKLPFFYRELVLAFQKANGVMKPNVTCINEAIEIPLWNNTVITNTDKKMDTKILKRHGMVCLKHVINNGNLLTAQELAKKCHIKPINAGKIMSGLRKHVSDDLLTENREGPARHVSSMLHFENNDESVHVSDTTVKTIYKSMVIDRFVQPIVEKTWPIKLNIRQNIIDWKEVWKKANTQSIDYDDRDLWFRLRHRILPTCDVLQKMKKIEPKDNQCGLCKQEEETIEHVFIYCKCTWTSWLFLEYVLRKYKGNKHFYLNDSNKILGYGKQIDNICLFLIAKLHRTIWNSRCRNLPAINPVSDKKLLKLFQHKLKRMILLEKQRLNDDDFVELFCKNQALCHMIGEKVVFSF